MSAASRLWHRAPLWRTCLVFMVIFSVLALIYPPAYLSRLLAPLHPYEDKLTQLSRRITGWPAASTQTAATSDPSSSSQDPQTANNAPQGAPQAPGPNTEQIAAPPITADLSGAIPFAGRILPLPAGIWHPVLTTTAGPHGELLTNVFVRADRGVVSGVIIAQGSTSSVRPIVIEDMDRSCHDDRNYLSRSVSGGNNMIECWFTNSVPIDDSSGMGGSDISAAFTRLHVLGFPMPPLMTAAFWNRVDASSEGGVNFERVVVLLSPAKIGTTQLPAPPEAFLKEGLRSVPATAQIVNNLNRWMTNWVPVLRDGYQGKIKAGSIPADISRDPAFPGNPS